MPTSIAGTDTFDATLDVPSGGDTRNAASVSVGLEALANRTMYLKKRVGVESIVEVDGDQELSLSTLATSNSAAWVNVPGPTPESYLLPNLTDIRPGDVIEITGMVHVANAVAGTTAYVRPSILSQPSYTRVSGAEHTVTKADDPRPIPIFARLVVPAGDDTWVVPWIEIKSGTGGNSVSILSPSDVAVRAYRRSP